MRNAIDKTRQWRKHWAYKVRNAICKPRQKLAKKLPRQGEKWKDKVKNNIGKKSEQYNWQTS